MAEELVTLLISDDEPAIRNGLASLPWADHGISLVGTARNGIETLRFAEEKKVDIFLMDIRMPGMSGMEVGEAVLQRNPQARVIFLSGYGEFEYARRALAMQAYDTYDGVVRYIESQLLECGGIGGDMIFHPWRQRADRWELSPHFHCLLFGFIDTRRFLRNNPGWIIKKIHAREKIRSIRHTMGYLQTHCGLARVEVNPDSVDWDMLVLSHFIPGLTTGKPTGFTDNDYELKTQGKGRMVGDLSDVDWVDWTMAPLCADLHHRYWGALSSKNIVRVDTYRQYRIRVCRECGALLRMYNGFGDLRGDYVRYIVDNPVMCFARNADAVRGFFLRFKSSLPKGEKVDIGELTRLIPVAVSPIEFREDNGDITVEGPFSEPDSFFLDRQRRATTPSD